MTTAAVAAVSMTAAVASPPTPLLTKLSDLARAQVVDGGTISTPTGTDSAAAMYTLAPGSGTGWRTAAGASALAVTKGTLTLQSENGCATKEYKAGQAAIVPPGRFLIANVGGAPLEFAGVFSKLAKNAGEPLDGAGAAAPAKCKAAAGYTAASTAAASAAEAVRGTMVPIGAYGHSVHAIGAAKGITVEPGKDMFVATATLLPGFSTGWVTHAPAIAILTKGTFTYYEDLGDGKCGKSEQHTAGQAYSHVGGFHLGTNESTEAVELTVIYFNMPHGTPNSFVPVVGNTMDSIDFTPFPPFACGKF